MEATIAEQRRSIGTTAVIAAVGAVAFVVASVWYGLAVRGVTVPVEPVFTGEETFGERFRIFFGWVVLTLPQERLYVSIAIVGFACLGVVTILAMRAVATDQSLSRAGTFGVVLGSSLWIVGNVLQLGAHRAVGSMATHGNPLPTVGAIFFTADTIDDAFETGAFAALGVGMLVLASATFRADARAWGRYTGVLGVLSLILVAAYVGEQGDVVNVLLLGLGVVVLPVWLVWTATRFSSPAADGRLS